MHGPCRREASPQRPTAAQKLLSFTLFPPRQPERDCRSVCSEYSFVRLRASVTLTNGTSLSVEPSSRIQPIAIGPGLSYHPL